MTTVSHLELTSEQAHIQHAIACSHFVSRLLTGDAALLPDLMENLGSAFSRDEMQAFLNAQAIHDEASLKRSLRKLRQRVMLRTIVRDLNGFSGLTEVMQGMSDLAEVTVNVALKHIEAWLKATYGKPIGKSGKPQSLVVIGMGKLGGYELNVSSDIDLIFAFEEDGETIAASLGAE